MKKGTCMKAILLIALLSALFLPLQVFAQSTASLSGRVTDASQAVLTSAEVTAINVETGMESRTTTNNSGIYSFPSLQPGTYRVSAQSSGFQNKTLTDVRLRMGVQSSLNFEMDVAGISTTIEVTSTAENMVLDAGSSTGTVLQENLVAELPLVSNDVMDLINIMGGVVGSENPIFSNFEQSFAGVQSVNINVSRDGISVSEVRWTSGIVSPSRINTDMVGEFRMVLSPVDAELGRGAGQVQITTRSGSNVLHGSGIWNIQNTALDAREWQAKRTNEEPSWRNLHNYTVNVSGPIVRNKTFFFANWDHQLVREKSSVRSMALTNCARLGIYRYFDGWVNTNALDHAGFQAPGSPFALPTRPVVDEKGNPLLTYTHPTSGISTTPQTMDDLKFYSVMGGLTDDAYNAIANDPINCSEYERLYGDAGLAFSNGANRPYIAPWSNSQFSVDPWGNTVGVRNRFDESGYVTKFTDLVPRANNFQIGDGLNTAIYKWTRTVKGSNTVYGTGQDGERKAISVKIDHNINSENRLSGTYNFERLIGEDSMPTWDRDYAYGGNIVRKPQSFMLGLTSTLSPTLINEFRFGLSRTYAMIANPIVAYPEETSKILYDLLPVSDQYPVVVGYDDIRYSPGYGWMFGGAGSSHPIGNMGLLGGSWGGADHRWTASDTVTWIKGAHSFKGGFEVRLAKSRQDSDGEGGFRAGAMHPVVGGGAMSTTPYAPGVFFGDGEFIGWEGMLGGQGSYDQPGGYGTVRNMLNWFSGSVQGVQQFFYAASAKDRRWNDLLAGEGFRVTDLRNREYAAFFKDDWRVSNSLTLNLGVRYEYYGIPWENNGMTVALVGGSDSLGGPYASSGVFSSFMPKDPSALAYNSAKLAQYEFVGPNSPNSARSAWNKDMNNFAPHVGFSWQLPWLGKSLTTLRGGYSISYTPITNFDGFGGIIAKVPGTEYRQTVGGTYDLPYLTLEMLKNGHGTILPLRAPDDPYYGVNAHYVLGLQPLTAREAAFNVYDDNIRNPYIQNLTLSLTRQIGSVLTVDVRYIGTLSRKQLSGFNINTSNYINNGLDKEFAIVRAGGESDVINSLVPPFTLGYAESGSEQVRTSGGIFPGWGPFGIMPDLIQGNYSAVAGALATANPTYGAAPGVNGDVLRSGCLPSQRLYGHFNDPTDDTNICTAPTPENLIYASPQFASATHNANRASSNYHSMQAQVTMRPIHGLSFQATYTWSRNITDQGINNYLTMERRHYLSTQHRSHTLSSYGSYELPLGARGFVFRDSVGALKKAVEGWQLSWIYSVNSGIPESLAGNSMLWGDNRPVLVRPDLWDNKAGKVEWGDDLAGADYYGNFYGNKYVRIPDPMCATVAASMQTTCQDNYKALALRSDPNTIVVRNALPGETANLMQSNSLTGPGRWNLDMAMSKSVEFMEGKRIEVRVDAQNIFNHPTPTGGQPFSWNARFTQIYNPDFALNSTDSDSFGRLTSKGGHRTFQAKISLRF